jgi:hypothetical protein
MRESRLPRGVDMDTEVKQETPGNWLVFVGAWVVLLAAILAAITVSDMSSTSAFGREIDYSTGDKIQAAALVGLVPGALGFIVIGIGQILNLSAQKPRP